MVDIFIIYDRSVELFSQSVRTDALTTFFIAVTNLASPLFIAVSSVAVLLIIALYKEYRYMFGFLVAVVGTQGTVLLLKDIIGRTRPALFRPLVIETSYAFPSAHAAISVAFFGFVGFLFFHHAHTWFGRWCAVIIPSVVAICVGASRVYLGVHFVSDVVGGWCIGVLWLIIAIIAFRHSRVTRERELRIGLKFKV
ncbi:MAG: phosphatase PAP2 family protein [Candidatus Paceibacterota bacterium]|jgi:undecaprenyl-diphosphatase